MNFRVTMGRGCDQRWGWEGGGGRGQGWGKWVKEFSGQKGGGETWVKIWEISLQVKHKISNNS